MEVTMASEYRLTRSQFNNLHAAKEDLDTIEREVKRAKKSGIPIDDGLEETCEDCDKRIKQILGNYKMMDEKEGPNHGKRIPGGSRRVL
jgi:hypothetical protein